MCLVGLIGPSHPPHKITLCLLFLSVYLSFCIGLYNMFVYYRNNCVVEDNFPFIYYFKADNFNAS